MSQFALDAPLPAEAAAAGYNEFLRVPGMSAGIHRVPRGALDPQRPHREDELYHVVRGRGRFEHNGRLDDVGPGTLLFVPKGEAPRFRDVTEDLVVLVVFAPAESQT